MACIFLFRGFLVTGYIKVKSSKNPLKLEQVKDKHP